MNQASSREIEFLVTRVVKHGESDAVLTLLLRDEGKLSVYVPKLRPSRKRFPSGLELFCLYRGRLEERASSLPVLREAHASRALHRISGSLFELSVASCGLELVREAAFEGVEQNALFEALWSFLLALDEHAGEASELATLSLRWLETRVLEEHGLFPSLDFCVRCGAELGASRCHLCRDGAGLSCPACASASEQAASLEPVLAHAMRRLSEQPLPTILENAKQRLHQAQTAPSSLPLERFNQQAGKVLWCCLGALPIKLRSYDFLAKLGTASSEAELTPRGAEE